jgi:hypothetical protein
MAVRSVKLLNLTELQQSANISIAVSDKLSAFSGQLSVISFLACSFLGINP